MENGHYYSFFYRDRIIADGSIRSVKQRFDHGRGVAISQLSARREHDRLRQQINRERGSVPTAPRGETFADAAKVYIESIAPHFSCSTVRQGIHTCGVTYSRDWQSRAYGARCQRPTAIRYRYAADQQPQDHYQRAGNALCNFG